MDVVARHGADLGSDHSLVLSKIKDQPPIDFQKLKNVDIKKAFQIEIKNKLSVLMEQLDVDMQDFNEVFIDTGKQLLGSMKRNRRNGSRNIHGRKWNNGRKRQRKRQFYQYTRRD